MKRVKLYLLCCSLLLCYTLTSHAASLVIGAEDSWPPFANPDGTGIGYDIVTAAFEAVDIDITFRVAPYKRVMEEAKEGQYVAYLHADRNPENQDAFYWPAMPLFSGHTDYFYHVDHPLSATSEQQLQHGERIGLVHGWGYSESLLSNSHIKKDWAPDEEKSLKKLAMGRIDAAVLWYVREQDVQTLLRKNDLEGKVRKAFSGGTHPLYLAFSKSYPNAQYLLQQFEEGMAIIKADGTYDTLLNQ